MSSSTERCQQEIDTVLEGKTQVSFEDRHKMPYMQAVIQESQRYASTLPLSVFHCTTRDTELMGYSIPKVRVQAPKRVSFRRGDGDTVTLPTFTNRKQLLCSREF